jgi:zinc transporter 1/2/3
MLHKWAAALTLGINFAREDIPYKQSALLITIFSLITPVGIVFGCTLAGLSAVIRSVFMSISAGTFIYIAGTEIIVEEFSLTRFRWRKYLAFLIGIALITILKSLECAGVLDG